VAAFAAVAAAQSDCGTDSAGCQIAAADWSTQNAWLIAIGARRSLNLASLGGEVTSK